jgi:dihydrofolate reductase
VPSPSLSLIAAIGLNRVIGRGGRLVLRLPVDRKWFERHTAGKTLLMGRLCYQAWPDAGRSQRRPVVITSQPERLLALPRAAGITAPLTAPSVPAGLQAARTLPGEIMVCGGQRVYEETLPWADRLYLTEIQAKPPGDRWFPDWRSLPWQETFTQEGTEDGFCYTFRILERRRA